MRNTFDIMRAFPKKYDGKTDWQDFKLTYMDQEQYMCNLGLTMAQRLMELKKVVDKPLIYYIKEFKLEDGNYFLAMEQLERVCSDRRAYILRELFKMFHCTAVDGTVQSIFRLHAEYSSAMASQTGLRLTSDHMWELLRIATLEQYYNESLKDAHGKWMQLRRSDVHPTGYNVTIQDVLLKLENMAKHRLRMAEAKGPLKGLSGLKAITHVPSHTSTATISKKPSNNFKGKSKSSSNRASRASLPVNFASQGTIAALAQKISKQLPMLMAPKNALCLAPATPPDPPKPKAAAAKARPAAAAGGPVKNRPRAKSAQPQVRAERVHCYFCNNTLNHAFPLRCPALKKANKAKIHSIVKEKRLCRNCLCPNHSARECNAATSIKCPKKNCGQRHSVYFHPGYTDNPGRPRAAASQEALVRSAFE